MKLKHFADEAAVRAYIQCEILATLEDDLNNMETTERRHYTNADRKEMRNRIHDIKAVIGEPLTIPV